MNGHVIQNFWNKTLQEHYDAGYAAGLAASEAVRHELVKALKGMVDIPVLRHVLGIRHTADCQCALCRARTILLEQG